MKYYKILRLNRASWHEPSFIWPARKAIEITQAEKGDPCGVGLHLAKSINDGFRYAKFPARVFEAVPLSPVLGEDDTKIRVARARLGAEVTPDCVVRVNEFMTTIPKVRWFSARRPARSEWQVFDTRDAARDAAWNAAWNAAGEAARDAARDAAGEAAGEAAGDAAGDAAIYASMLICPRGKLDPGHIAHIKARWDVWQRGYGLLCDVRGVLYVYRKP